jgi:hypothetical protein
MFFHSDIFEYGDVLLWRRFVAETLCYRRHYVTGDIMSLRHPITETFCKEVPVLSSRHFGHFVSAPKGGVCYSERRIM